MPLISRQSIKTRPSTPTMKGGSSAVKPGSANHMQKGGSSAVKPGSANNSHNNANHSHNNANHSNNMQKGGSSAVKPGSANHMQKGGSSAVKPMNGGSKKTKKTKKVKKSKKPMPKGFAYCLICGKQTEMLNPETRTTKNGRKQLVGEGKCGHKVYRFI